MKRKQDFAKNWRRIGLFFTLSLSVLFATTSSATDDPTVVRPPSSGQPAQVARQMGNGLVWPTTGIISQGFHTYHTGIDIAGAPGTPIVAVKEGVVVTAGWDDWGLGYAVTLQHPDESRTVYGHNRRLLVRQGQSVQQGQLIAEMGSTGNSSGPHLHFEFYPSQSRQAVNPMYQLPPLVGGRIPTTESQAAEPNLGVMGQGASRPESNQRTASTLTCDEALLDRETTNFYVQVCRQGGQLYYIGRSKLEAQSVVRLPAFPVAGGYRAQNGSFSYVVRGERVEVFRNGVRLRTEYFL
ncbi:M23 family metallopeptidase [Spirulina subsalsa FACHB-351]|uniref:M23 family metallopeptidase n=1 Tax=Spirulina subsalsa FACHB-351 TaxID=234711 RepID=A0ABT3L1U4_9CYAN|nr:M23 family metallopeptidase [Spirulina subsalsa]MCW6035473.1 M23 family metallopeptidase [Spirulina subsalsa FACHB-351]